MKIVLFVTCAFFSFSVNADIGNVLDSINPVTYVADELERAQKRIDRCVVGLNKNIPRYGAFLENHYINVNNKKSNNILEKYKILNARGISDKLKSGFDPKEIERLVSSTSTIEYMDVVLSSLKQIQNDLKNNNYNDLDVLIKRTQFYMFAWVAPMEIFSSYIIYDSSLLGFTSDLYGNLNKDTYINYNKFINSLMFSNVIKGVITNDRLLYGNTLTTNVLTKLVLEDHVKLTQEESLDLSSICDDMVNYYAFSNFLFFDDEVDVSDKYLLKDVSSGLGIDESIIKDYFNMLSENKHSNNSSVIFGRNMDVRKDINIFTDSLNDDWYLMIREYMEMQDVIYQSKSEVNNIIKILSIMQGNEKVIATLKINLFHLDALFREIDEAVRYNIIDLPISIYADIYSLKFNKAKGLLNDNEELMSDISVAYNKSCANLQKYVSSEFIKDKLVRINSEFKSEFDDDEWKQVIARAKLSQNWFNMLNKVKIQNM